MKRINEISKTHLSKDPELFKEFLKIEEGDELWEEWKNEDTSVISLDESMSEQIIQTVTEHTRRPKVMYMGFKLLAAACIAALVVAGVFYFSFSDENGRQTQLAIVKQKDVQTVKKENRGEIDMQLILPDHSIVLLHPQSSVSYDAVCFKNNDTAVRSIFLTGSAFFKVAKNPRKPFTVYSGGLSTVALGTEFDVVKHDENTTIKLYEGKVLVSVLKPHKGWAKGVVLVPGQMVSLSDGVPKKINDAVLPAKAKDSISTKRKLNIKIEPPTQLLPLQCDNMPLEDVLKTLEQYYKVSIIYDKELLKDKYFSGEVLPDKSPDAMLNIICNMQHLIAEKSDSGYLIHQ